MGELRKGSKRNFQWVRPFLKAIAHNGNITQSAKIAGVSPSRIYQYKKSSPTFRRALSAARRQAADRLEKVAWQRATKKDGSDMLLMFLLKAIKRKKYGQPTPKEDSRTTVQILNVVQGMDIQTLRKLAQAAKARLEGQDEVGDADRP